MHQTHPSISEQERRKLCRIMNCQKLSLDACMHVAQNDRLPLKIVIQVILFALVQLVHPLHFAENFIAKKEIQKYVCRVVSHFANNNHPSCIIISLFARTGSVHMIYHQRNQGQCMHANLLFPPPKKSQNIQ